MKRLSYILIFLFWMSGMLAVQAAPTMAGRIKSYDGSKGLLVLERDDKSIRTFKITDKTVCLYNGRKTSPAALRKGSKVSIQIVGALNRDPLKAGKIVDWTSSDTIVAKGAKAPYHTKVSQFATESGGGGIPDGAPVGNHAPQQTMAAIAHGGAVNVPNPATHPGMLNNGHSNGHSGTGGHPGNMGHSGTQMYNQGMYTNQGQTTMMPLHQMNTNPLFNSSAGDLMGNSSTGGDSSMIGMNSPSYGTGGSKMTGRVMQVQDGFVLLQSFEHPKLQRVILGMASASPELLMPGKMIEVYGTQTAQGFQATQIKAASSY